MTYITKRGNSYSVRYTYARQELRQMGELSHKRGGNEP